MGAVVGVLVFCLAALWVVQRDRALPNTVVAGVDVGGLSSAEVHERLEPVVRRRQHEPVVLRLPDDATDLATEGDDALLLSPDEVGYHVELDQTVEAVMARGRTGLPGDVVERLRAFRVEREVDLRHDEDELTLDDWVESLADRLDRDESLGDVVIDPDDLSVQVQPSHGRVRVARDELRSDLHRVLHGQRRDVDVPAQTSPQPISDVDLEAARHTVERALDGPLELSAEGESLTLDPADVAELLTVRTTTGGVTGTTLEVVVTAEAVDDAIGDAAGDRFDVEPVDASYTASRTPPSRFDAQGNATYRPVEASIELDEGRDGRRFDAERAAEQLTELVGTGAREAQLDLVRVSAEFDADQARELRPTHAIGTFTTYYTAGQTRNHNIQRLADVIDGALVLPGEQFSINAISGQRSCDKGYLPAGTIVQGELVDTCGGGTSQFGTTTFNAAFFAGVQLDQWRAHSWYISRYPMGREATLSYPVLDVKFTNTTDGAILVKTAHTSSSVTVTLYGQPIASAVSAEHGQPTNHRPYDTEVRTSSELPQGQERVEQSGAGGFQVRVVRTVQLLQGGQDTRTISTTYVPQTRIITRGTGSSPDEDEDEDDD